MRAKKTVAAKSLRTNNIHSAAALSVVNAFIWNTVHLGSMKYFCFLICNCKHSLEYPRLDKLGKFLMSFLQTSILV